MNASKERVRSKLDPFRPHVFFIERERAEDGAVVPVATVFLTNRECPWRCLYCDLWKNTLSETVPAGAIPSQIDFALAEPGIGEARQIKLYNAGSFFDPKAIPPEDFPAIAKRVAGFDRVIVESHPALIDDAVLRFRDLLMNHEPQTTSGVQKLEIAMGLEIADDEILVGLNKRMTLKMFSRAAEFLVQHDIAVRVFVIVKPPFVRTDSEALAFARRSVDFAFDCRASVVSLIPARAGTAELEVLASTGDFAPPKIETLEAAHDYGLGLRRGRVFADLWDFEKLVGCQGCVADRRERLNQMNLEQAVLPRIQCQSCGKTEAISAACP